MGGRGGGSGGGAGGIKRDSSGAIMSITRGGRTFSPRRPNDPVISIPATLARVGDEIVVSWGVVSPTVGRVQSMTSRQGGVMFETSKGPTFSGSDVSFVRGLRR